jgi:hypothetical protein
VLEFALAPTVSRRKTALILVIAGILGAIAPFVLAPSPPSTGWVLIASTPPGAPVSIDGVLRGPSPFGTSLEAGKHRVDVGRDPVVRSQTFYVTAGGDTAVHVELPPQPDPATANVGGLEIITQPANARVSIDGKEHGVAPLTVNGLTRGTHEVLVTTSAGSMSRQVTVEEGTVSSVFMAINNVGGFPSGWLTITSPVVAEIREGGTLLGTTNTPRLLIPAGEHHLEISNPAFGYRVERTVRIRARQSQTITLEVPKGTLHVNASPWAEVWINGTRVGDTPIGNISLPIGHHDVRLRHPRLGERRQQVAVGLDGPTRIGVDLRR